MTPPDERAPAIGPDGRRRPSEPLERILALAADTAPRCGPTVVIGIDGPSGSGKSTLAAVLAGRLGCPVVHMDDLFPGWDGLAQATGLLTEQVLRPLAEGRDAVYRTWDWDAGHWNGTVSVPATARLIVEGCGCTVRPAADYVAVPVWIEAAHDVRMARGIERDGEAFRPHWERWAQQEHALFTADGTRGRAAVVVRT